MARPIAPAATITRGSGSFLRRHRTSTTPARIAIVGMSMIARRPSTNAAPAIAPVAAAVTPSTNALTPRCDAKRCHNGEPASKKHPEDLLLGDRGRDDRHPEHRP